MSCRIVILGDFNPAYETHHALNESIRQCALEAGEAVYCDWIATDVFDCKAAFNRLYSGLWIAPGSPYKNADIVLDAIRYARVNAIPTLGNCGGFQYMLIEFARNVCGINAHHAETDPLEEELVISKLSCSLVRQEEQLTVIDADSLLHRIIGASSFKGRYFCSYGINKKYQSELAKHGCSFTTLSSDGDVRSFELKSHAFFMGTLFQPALSSSADEPDPIITEFFKNCIAERKKKQ